MVSAYNTPAKIMVYLFKATLILFKFYPRIIRFLFFYSSTEKRPEKNAVNKEDDRSCHAKRDQKIIFECNKPGFPVLLFMNNT